MLLISFVNNPSNPFATFGELHPNIMKQLDIKTNSLLGFEFNLDKYVKLKEKNKKTKISYESSEYQKSERDFAFIVDKNIQAQELLNLIKNVDLYLIKDISVFDLYEGENIPNEKKSLAFKFEPWSSPSFDSLPNSPRLLICVIPIDIL